jgi:hypothetical protein
VKAIVGDLNHDNIVDIFDAEYAAKAFGSHPGDPNWNPDADLDHEPPSTDTIDIFDLILLASHFGQTM